MRIQPGRLRFVFSSGEISTIRAHPSENPGGFLHGPALDDIPACAINPFSEGDPDVDHS